MSPATSTPRIGEGDEIPGLPQGIVVPTLNLSGTLRTHLVPEDGRKLALGVLPGESVGISVAEGAGNELDTDLPGLWRINLGCSAEE